MACITCLITLVGALYLLRKAYILGRALYFHFRKHDDFELKYGKDSWVVVTGSTDGIGKEFAIQYAKLNFNIVQVARNPEKVKKVEEELKKINPKIKLKYIKADFVNGLQPGFYQDIEKQLQGLDISVLVNNVGIGDLYDIDEFPSDYAEQMITVNINSQVFMTKMVVPIMRKREKRSAIINLSSNSAVVIKPYQTLYGGTKGFNLIFSKTASMELRDKIDVIAACPSMVETPILLEKCSDPKTLEKARTMMITTSQFVLSVFNQLGYVDQTTGYIKHKFFRWLFQDALIYNQDKILTKMQKMSYNETKKTRELKAKKQQ